MLAHCFAARALTNCVLSYGLVLAAGPTLPVLGIEGCGMMYCKYGCTRPSAYNAILSKRMVTIELVD